SVFPALSAPFNDVPASHWAQNAVQSLAEKGLLEGYHGGTFRGEKSASRYEMAMVVARIVANLEKIAAGTAKLPDGVTKADLDAAIRLMREYKKELEAFGFRTNRIEESLENLEARVTELERVKIYGSYRTVGTSQGFTGTAPNSGSTANAALDYSTGRLLLTGSAVTSLARIGANAMIAKSLQAGAELVAFASIGTPGVSNYWGVTAPYLSNIFLGNGATIRANLDNVWLLHPDTRTRTILGAYDPGFLEPFVLKGITNPNALGPPTLPYFGGNIQTVTGIPFLSGVEIMHSRLANASPYPAAVSAAFAGYTLGKTKLGLNYTWALNDAPNAAAGGVTLPGSNWIGTNSVLRNTTGPQSQTNLGLSLNHAFPRDWSALLELAKSYYNPDRTATLFNTITQGGMLHFAVKGKVVKLDVGGEYLRISPTYDSFVSQYPQNPQIPLFLPVSSYYTNYYQIHDSQKYPNNRQGFRLSAGTGFNIGRLDLGYEAISQMQTSSQGNLAYPGFIEPLFPALTGGESTGKIDDYSISLSLRPRERLGLRGAYYNYLISRASSTPADDMSLIQSVGLLGADYRLGDSLLLLGDITFVTLKGHSGLTNLDLRQSIPAVGLGYTITPSSVVNLKYKVFNFTNAIAANSDWNGPQTMLDWNFRF
ncbi:MAG: S-layer homology domain-containing protein, partial [Armatimonadetes bacterium]|nr:S-layer homology domain-containing protein [Armatimonadota bacterium]